METFPAMTQFPTRGDLSHICRRLGRKPPICDWLLLPFPQPETLILGIYRAPLHVERTWSFSTQIICWCRVLGCLLGRDMGGLH